jgi:hypothetical protein
MTDTATASIGFAQDHDVEAFRKSLPFKVEPTNIPGIYSIPAPPKDFDPLTASQHELLRHGILIRKPNEEDDPVLRASWEQFCSNHWAKMVRVNPELQVRSRVSRHPRLRLSTESAGLDTQDNWAGALNIGAQWIAVFANWQVPTVSIPPSQTLGQENTCPGGMSTPAGPWQSATWIGLGGFVLDQGEEISESDIIQVGIQQNISAENGEVTYQAFFEWYTSASSIALLLPNLAGSAGFSVQHGDMISASVINDPHNRHLPPQVSLHNARSGQNFSYVFGSAPPGSNYQGGSCEWIMEATNQTPFSAGGYPTVDDSTFPYFTPVVFNGAIACNAPGTTVEPLNLMLPLEIHTQTPNSCQDNGQLTTVTATRANYTVEIDCTQR